MSTTTTTTTGLRPANNDPPQTGKFATSAPQDPTATAGPPVWFTDPSGDADGAAGNVGLSQPAFDLVQLGWAPATEVDPRRPGYTVSIVIAGGSRTDGIYVTWGTFGSNVPGERCELYHFLTPGSTAWANAWCGSIEDGTRRLVGRLQGTTVTTSPTPAGGTLITAMFDDSVLPLELEAGGRRLFTLSAYACPGTVETPTGCLTYQPSDVATSYRSYRI